MKKVLCYHHPFKATFQGGPYQNVRYIFWHPPVNVKLVTERPPGVVFVGRLFKTPSKRKLTSSKPPIKDTLKNVVYILGVSLPLKTVVVLFPKITLRQLQPRRVRVLVCGIGMCKYNVICIRYMVSTYFQTERIVRVFVVPWGEHEKRQSWGPERQPWNLDSMVAISNICWTALRCSGSWL